MQILEILAKAPDAESLKECLPQIRILIRQKQTALRSGCVPLEELIVLQTVSRNLTEFRSPFSSIRCFGATGKHREVPAPGSGRSFGLYPGHPARTCLGSAISS